MARLGGSNFTPPSRAYSGSITTGILTAAGATFSGLDVNGILTAANIDLSQGFVGVDTYTKLLLHNNSNDSSTSFIDSSGTGKAVTANGDAKISASQSKFGGSSALFDGTGDYLSLADSDDWNFGSGDFTIDGWFRANVWADANYQLLGQNSYGSTNNAWNLWGNGGASQNLQFHYKTDGSTDNNTLRSSTS